MSLAEEQVHAPHVSGEPSEGGMGLESHERDRARLCSRNVYGK